MIDVPASKERIRGEQLTLFHQGSPAAVAGTAAAVAIVVMLLWSQVPRGRLLSWALLMSVPICTELVYYFRLLPARRAGRLHAVDMRGFCAAFALEAAMWAFGMFYILPADLSYQALMLLILSMVATVGAVYLSSYLPAMYAFDVPVLGLSAIAMFSQGTFIHAVLGIILLVALSVIIVFSRNFNGTLTAAIAADLRTNVLVQELMVQKEAAEKANLAKTRFLAAASHDLRQPMHTIGLLVGIMHDRVTSAEDRQLVARIHAAVLAMENLFKGLLDISKLDAGVVKPEVTAFPLFDLLEVIKLRFASQAQAKGLSLRVHNTRAVVDSDPIILERILANLVSNAVRYTETGRVLVGCRRKDGALRIEVWDTGPGIPVEERENVFQEFVQLHNPERDRSKGLGLGLSIVKRSASLLGHRLDLRSVVGKGSCFSIEVPRAARSSIPAPVTDKQADGDLVAGSFIVVVDDEQDIRFATQALLEQWGCHVVCAASAQEAIDALKVHLRTPDLIISDYRLRDNLTGLDAVAAIRAALEENIPTIIITGDSAAGDIQQVSKLGLPLAHKPIGAEHLRKLVADILQQAPTRVSGK